MAKIAPVQETIAEKIELIDLTEEKANRKKSLFVIIPVAVTVLTVATFFVVRRFRSKSEI